MTFNGFPWFSNGFPSKSRFDGYPESLRRPDELDPAGPSFAQTWLSRQRIRGGFLTNAGNGPFRADLPSEICDLMVINGDLSSGKRLHNYGTPFLMGKSIISMAIFHSYVQLPESSSFGSPFPGPERTELGKSTGILLRPAFAWLVAQVIW